MTEVILYSLLGIISIFVIREYLQICLAKKYLKNYTVFWIVNLLIAELLEFNTGIPIINTILNFAFILYICVLRYKGDLKIKIIVSFSLIVIWGITEIIVGLISGGICLHFLEPRIQGAILSKLFTLLFIKIIKYVKLRYWSKESLEKVPQNWWMLIMLPACSICIVYYMFFLLKEKANEGMFFGGLLSSCLFLPLNLGIFKIYDLLVSEYETREENIIYAQCINLFDKGMREKEVSLLDRQQMHDYKKHIFAIQQIAKKNGYKEIQYYCNELESQFMPENILINSGNVVIDSMINSKYAIAIRDGVEFQAEITVPVEMDIHSADLCVILGNILDNAYEAVQKIDEKIVTISIFYSVGKLIIGVRNTYNGLNSKDNNEKYITSKEDKENHGFGLGIVKKVVEKYEGFINIESDNNFFSLVAVLKENKS